MTECFVEDCTREGVEVVEIIAEIFNEERDLSMHVCKKHYDSIFREPAIKGISCEGAVVDEKFSIDDKILKKYAVLGGQSHGKLLVSEQMHIYMSTFMAAEIKKEMNSMFDVFDDMPYDLFKPKKLKTIKTSCKKCGGFGKRGNKRCGSCHGSGRGVPLSIEI